MSNNTEWKSVTVKADEVQGYSPKCNRIMTHHGGGSQYSNYLYIPAKLCRFDKAGFCKISYLPQFDFAAKLEAFVAAREKAAIVSRNYDAISEAIWNMTDENEEYDRLFDEWRDAREEAEKAARIEAADDNLSFEEIDAAVYTAGLKVDAIYLEKYSA